ELLDGSAVGSQEDPIASLLHEHRLADPVPGQGFRGEPDPARVAYPRDLELDDRHVVTVITFAGKRKVMAGPRSLGSSPSASREDPRSRWGRSRPRARPPAESARALQSFMDSTGQAD